MTYTPNVPVTGDSLGSTRDRIRTNFQQIAIIDAVNHVSYNSVGAGKHNYLQMPEVTASGAGVPTTLANEGGFYTDVATNPAESNLWFRAENNGFKYQLTRVNSAYTATFAKNKGWTFLPGGLLLQYGFITGPGTSGTVTFPIPFFLAYYSITLGLSRNGSSSNQNAYIDNSVALSTTSFAYTSTSASTNPIYWMAIGN